MKLSPRQQAVMKWVEGGWTLKQEYGCTVWVNGFHICNLDTVMALLQRGLIKKVDQWTWGKA